MEKSFFQRCFCSSGRSFYGIKLNYCRFTSEYLKKAVIMQCFIECEKLSFAFKSHFTGFNGNNNSMNNKCNRFLLLLQSALSTDSPIALRWHRKKQQRRRLNKKRAQISKHRLVCICIAHTMHFKSVVSAKKWSEN